MKIFSFDESQYGFREMVAQLFGVSSLETLHLFRKDMVHEGDVLWKSESDSDFHRAFYSKLNLNGPGEPWQEMIDAYDSFVRGEIVDKLGGDVKLLIQKFPSFRVQTPNSQAIHKWHFDSDEDHGHPNGEINVQVPLTVMYDTSATWIEPIPGMGKFEPMQMFPGQYSIFNGNKCMHGNKKNVTGLTRVSFDFRVIPKEVLESQSCNASATLGVKFANGGYYKEI